MRPLLLSVLVACGTSTVPPDARPDLDVEGVQAEFRPSAAAVADLVGVSYQLPGEPTPAAQAIRGFAEGVLRQAGIHHARADLLWAIVEPTRGAFDWSSYHVKVEGYASAGVETLPILCYGNPWANAKPGLTTVPPDDVADYAAYAAAAATEFHGRLPVYEIWNEENLGFQFWQPREQPDRYGDLLAAAATSIRAADPAARVMLGGLLDHAYVNLDAETFLQRLYRARPQIASSYDILAIHPYMTYPPAVEPERDDAATGEIDEPRMIARLRAVLAYWGDDPARPLWATEVGWPTFKTVDEDRQARWTVRSLLLLAGAGVDRVFVYTMFDGANPSGSAEDAFGLFHYQDAGGGTFAPAPKLAWTALATLLAIAGPLAITADVSTQLAGAPTDARAYRLTGTGARRVTVVWRADDSAATTKVTVPVASTSLQVVDMLGAPLPASAAVPLSGRPVYVIENP